MNTVSSFKKLPLIGAVLLALAVFPGASMAEKGDGYGDRGRSDKHSSYERKNSYNGDSHRGNKFDNKHGNKHGNKHAAKSHHYDRHKRGYDKHSKHGKHWKGKQYGHDHDHGHARYVVNNYGYRPHHSHHVGFDDLRFMIGLHNPNLDIVFRN